MVFLCNVLIVDDEPKIRRGLRKWVEEYGDPFKLVAESESIFQSVAAIESFDIRLAFLDIQLSNENGLDIARRIRELNPQAIVVIITGYDYFEYAHEAIKLSVYDYLLKPVPRTDFFNLLSRIDKLISDDGGSSKPSSPVSENYSAIVFRVKNYLEVNYDQPDLTLEKVASMFNINRTYLSRLMKAETGHSFSELLTMIRVGKAKEILKYSTSQVKMYEVAKKVGYGSQHYFSRVFRNCEGVSPSEYRSNFFDDQR